MSFPEIDTDQRTDVPFDEMSKASHLTGHTLFSELSIGMVSQFPLNFMHLFCLGLVKRLINLWLKGPLDGQRLHQQLQVYRTAKVDHFLTLIGGKPQSSDILY